LRAAATSSTRLVRVECGACFTSSGSVSTSLADRDHGVDELIQLQLAFVSVGSIISAPCTIMGKLTV